MTGSLFSKLKFALMTLAAVLFVLVGAYTMGGRAARQAIEEKARQEDRSKRAARTVLTGMCYSVGSATRQGSSS
ncbi:hypothetical protein LVR36_19415, partial [Klebsiella variicola subsp. variicola]|uniref:hypothetical protein n=1 Tax=Klebsiella variicola TaxID=244366 RepID=UPI001E519C6D